MTIEQQSLFAAVPSSAAEQQRRIAAHNRALETTPLNPYATTWDTAIHSSDTRAEAMMRLRTLLHQQMKRCGQGPAERARFLQILISEMRIKQSTTDAAQWVRKALLAFNYKNLS
jgi:hypothetical protein